MDAEANGDGGDDSPARRVLLKHEQLLGWQIMKERAGFGLRVLTGIVGVAAAVLVGSLIWEASQERGLVIEPFSVPPEFAERGGDRPGGGQPSAGPSQRDERPDGLGPRPLDLRQQLERRHQGADSPDRRLGRGAA